MIEFIQSKTYRLPSQTFGAAFILAASTLYGATGIVAKPLFAKSPSVFAVAAVRISVTWLLLGAALLVLRPQALRVDLKDIPRLLLFGAVSIGMSQLTYLFTMTQANVAVAVLLQSLSPAFTYAISLVFRLDSWRGRRVLALVMALAGGAAVVLGKGGWGGAVTALGLASGLLSAVCWSSYSLLSKPWLNRYSQWTLLFWGSGFAVLGWSLVIPPGQMVEAVTQDAYAAASFLLLAGACTLIPAGLYLKGLRLLTPTQAGIAGTFEPVAAAVLAYLFLGETLTWVQQLGAAVTLLSLAILHSDYTPSTGPRPAASP